MRVLNLEDTAIKHNDICKVLKSCGIAHVDWARNLEKGLEMLEESLKSETPYDLVITDMYYPTTPGGGDAPSGELFLQKRKEMGWQVPVIVCSTIRFRYPELLGAVHYSEKEDWESVLRELLQRIV